MCCLVVVSGVNYFINTVLFLSGSIMGKHSEGHWFESVRNFYIFHCYFYYFEGSWFESIKHRIIINTEAKANVVPTRLLLLYLEDLNQVPSVWKYTKW